MERLRGRRHVRGWRRVRDGLRGPAETVQRRPQESRQGVQWRVVWRRATPTLRGLHPVADGLRGRRGRAVREFLGALARQVHDRAVR